MTITFDANATLYELLLEQQQKLNVSIEDVVRLELMRALAVRMD